MKRAVLLHGRCDREEYFDRHLPSLSNSHWFPWLQKELLCQGIDTQTPEIHEAFQARYDEWERRLESFTSAHVDLLVGHSCGAGVLLRWLSEKGIICRRLILVAPWLDPYREHVAGFFDFAIDVDIAKRTEICLVFSDDDIPSVQKSVEIVKGWFPAVKEFCFPGYGHFCKEDMGIVEFPELLQICLGNFPPRSIIAHRS